ncbi:MAG TPA: hypothetical protein VFZ61_23285 [Polyangiales bacterium]
MAAQAAPVAPSVPPAPVVGAPGEAPLVDLVPAPGVPAGVAPPVAASLSPAQLTQQILALEEQSLALEAQRAKVRTLGYRIGKIVCWSVSAIFLFTAFGWYGTANSVEKALKDGRDDEAYDVNGNDKVTKHDEDVARTVARTLAITSLIPIGLGVFTTLMHRRREKERRDLTHDIEDLANKRRGLVRRLSLELSASPANAGLTLGARF